MYLANIQNGKEQKIYQISSIDSNIHGIRWNEQLTSLKKFGRRIFSSQKCSCPRSLRSLKKYYNMANTWSEPSIISSLPLQPPIDQIQDLDQLATMSFGSDHLDGMF